MVSVKSSSKAARAVVPSPKPTAPDIVDRLFDYMAAHLMHLSVAHVTTEAREEIELALREHFGGEWAWVSSAERLRRAKIAREVLARFNGRNATEVARELGIGRSAVYRIIKQAGRPPE